MNAEHLKSFHKVALTGSFTRASGELFLTQSAVSQQIKALESSLGITLFDRTGRQARLTGEGKILLSYTQRLFTLYDEIETLFGHIKELQKGSITIASTAVMGTYFLPGIIGRYNKQYPGLEIDLRMGNSRRVLDMIREGGVDLGFAGWIKVYPRLQSLLIHKEKLLVVASPDHPLAAKKSVSAQELDKTPFIWRERGTQIRMLVTKWFQKETKGTYPGKSIELQNVEAAKRIVVEGYGVTIIPEVVVRREIHTGLLKSIDVQGFDLTLDYYLFFVKGKNLSKAAEAFLDMLAETRMFSHTATIDMHQR